MTGVIQTEVGLGRAIRRMGGNGSWYLAYNHADRFAAMVVEPHVERNREMFRSKLSCSFCGRSETEVARMVAGPRVFICDRCAAIVIRIMNESSPPEHTPATRGAPMEAVLERLQHWWRRDRTDEAVPH